MQCYTELIPPSGVTHALSVSFTSLEACNLILVRTSLLQIFRVKQVSHVERKLVLIAEYNLAGTVTSLSRVKILNPRCGEAILVAFRDAKLSLIEWDPEKHSICTISIHYYESELQQRNPWAPPLRDCVNYLTVDPSSRCALFNFGLTNVAIIPFHQPGDDLIMDDYEVGIENQDAGRKSPSKQHVEGDLDAPQTPYASSFVLPLTSLDPGLLHPVHMAFLHEYREPTFGVIYSTVARSANLNYERKDVTQYAVFTLDLEQRASTILLAITKLPNDLFAVVPLPLPVGGALLIGANELMHVDQGGKVNAVAMNEFARQTSSFSMADQSQLQLRLENCQVQQINSASGDMLVILKTGELAVLSFRLDGRSVSGMSIQMLNRDLASAIFRSRASCVTSVGAHQVFIGSEVADSVLLSTGRKPQNKRHSQGVGQQSAATTIVTSKVADPVSDGSPEEDEEEDDEDDLYGDTIESITVPPNDVVTPSGPSIRILDKLPVVAPIRDVLFSHSRTTTSENQATCEGELDTPELIAASGAGPAAGLSIIKRDVPTKKVRQMNDQRLNGVWTLFLNHSSSATDHRYALPDFPDVMIASKKTDDGDDESTLYKMESGTLQEMVGTEFDPSAGGTVECGSIMRGSQVVQVLEAEIRVWDKNFGLAQIAEVADGESNANAKAVSASFADPYVLVLRDDHSLLLLKADRKGELDEIKLPSELHESRCICATLYEDNHRIFTSASEDDSGSSRGAESTCILTLLTLGGAIIMYTVADAPTKRFHYEGAFFLPNLFVESSPCPRHWVGSPTVSEIVLTDLGDGCDIQPYLIFRFEDNGIVLYHPFKLRSSGEKGHGNNFGFRKIASRWLPESGPSKTNPENGTVQQSIRPMKSAWVNGLLVILVPGTSPAVVVRKASSSPQIYHLGSETISSFTSYRNLLYRQGLAYVDGRGDLFTAQISPEACLGQSPWPFRRLELGHTVIGMSYLERTGSYVLATSLPVDFQLPQNDEWHTEWKDEETNCLPRIEEGSVRLLSPSTYNILDTVQLESAERAMCIKTMNLEISEETHERKDLIVVGTAITKGEDVLARGAIYLFDVVDVVPQPGIPETDLKLKLVAKEEVKGGVTSISPIGSQGFLLAAQGQKCMVRGLKEDLSILPVAFMDMKYYVTVVKELDGTGLCVLGDGMDGLWFAGYSEEPYKLQLFGRNQMGLEVMAAEFLPDGNSLYIIVADADGHIHVLQFDPDFPGSERGTKLLHRSSFASGAFLLTLNILPRPKRVEDTPDAFFSLSNPCQILTTSQEGSVGLLTSLDEQAYRRLVALQNTLTVNLEHACGLNPRAYRAAETDGMGGAAIVDGNILLRWLEQDLFHQESSSDKVGSDIWEIREDLRRISGEGVTAF